MAGAKIHGETPRLEATLSYSHSLCGSPLTFLGPPLDSRLNLLGSQIDQRGSWTSGWDYDT